MAKIYFIKLLLIYFLCYLCTPKKIKKCLNFNNPINVDLRFCSDYQSQSCCDSKMDYALETMYDRFTDYNVSGVCKYYFKNILCQLCNPNSTQLYNIEHIRELNLSTPLPNLCLKFCKKLHKECKSIINAISHNSLIDKLSSANKFCNTLHCGTLNKCFSVDKPKKLQRDLNEEPCICVKQVAQVSNPTFLTGANDGTDRLFIVQQDGKILIMEKNGTVLSDPFLDIKDQVVFHEKEYDERGLLGLAFHPNFLTNKKFYIQYNINPIDNINNSRTRLSEMKVDKDNPYKADKSAERILLEFDKPFANHNGGTLFFGMNDGYLYLSPGDGGGAGDPYGNAQNKSTFLGKMLRIDVNKVKDSKQYMIPKDNPFVNDPDAKKEIFAYGIRNSWRCSQDRGDKKGNNRGRIFCGEVGQDLYEEINIIEKGGNYGWNARESMECFKKEICGKIGDEILPITFYGRKDGISVIGGYVYRGCEIPFLEGLYIFGDWINGHLWVLQENEKQKKWIRNDLKICSADKCLEGLQSTYLPFISSFGEDDKGEIYILSRSNPMVTPPGLSSIYKIVDPKSFGKTKCSQS